VELMLAYVVTVHQSQGCGFSAVIVPMLIGPERAP